MLVLLLLLLSFKAAVHVGFRDGQFASNLTVKEVLVLYALKLFKGFSVQAFSSPLNLIVSCTEDKISKRATN